MIDFKIKGTRLPNLPRGLTLIHITSGLSKKLIMSHSDWISDGFKIYNNEKYVSTFSFLFKESDLIKLAKEQGMIEEEFKLPAEWYIVVTEENKEIVGNWYSKTFEVPIGFIVGMYNWGTVGYSFIRKEYNPKISENWKNEITFDQFKKYVLKMEDKKIIGYKCPIDMTSCCYSKDDVLVPYTYNKITRYRHKNFDSNGYFPLPAEIVETWEPVYEEPKVKVGDLIFNSAESVVKVTSVEGDKVIYEYPNGDEGDNNIDDVTLATKEDLDKLIKFYTK